MLDGQKRMLLILSVYSHPNEPRSADRELVRRTPSFYQFYQTPGLPTTSSQPKSLSIYQAPTTNFLHRDNRVPKHQNCRNGIHRKF